MTTLYEQIGGETTIRTLVDRFYDVMDQDPAYQHLRDMHPADLTSSRQKLFMFLSGWMGGPDLYVQAKGHPMLRRRHLPFKIGNDERDQWMACMKIALEEADISSHDRAQLLASFQQTADHMRNTA